MELPVAPPVAPMLARLTRSLPSDGYVYEPKWDGFRCLVFRQGAALDMRSRNDRPLARYFPELAEGFARLGKQRFTLDGEIVIVNETGADFAALLSRLHPAASRVDGTRRRPRSSRSTFLLSATGICETSPSASAAGCSKASWPERISRCT